MPTYFKKINVENKISQSIFKKQRIGLVPTMGALHRGHLSLIKKAFNENDVVWVSIFINPTQFNNSNDLINYPKNLKNDELLIKKISKSIEIFSPNEFEIYGENPKIKKYDFKTIENELEGRFRKNHFSGVATIVSKLLSLFKPNNVYFGEKDYQQTQIIKKLISLEKINVNLNICPTVREKNGLALSSRNNFLSNSERNDSYIIYKSLIQLKNNFNTSNLISTKKEIKDNINQKKNFQLEYLEIADASTLKIQSEINPKNTYRAFICVRVNDIRLIDNILLN